MSSRLKIVAAVYVVAGLCAGCPYLKMTTGDSISVINRSSDTIHLLVNDSYPDTSVEGAWYSSFVRPHDQGGLGIVNRTWGNYLAEKGAVTILFATSRPSEFERRRAQGEQIILGTMTLTKAGLDSLGGVIAFPPH